MATNLDTKINCYVNGKCNFFMGTSKQLFEFIWLYGYMVMDYLLGIKWPMQNAPAKNMNFNSHNIDELE